MPDKELQMLTNDIDTLDAMIKEHRYIADRLKLQTKICKLAEQGKDKFYWFTSGFDEFVSSVMKVKDTASLQKLYDMMKSQWEANTKLQELYDSIKLEECGG